MRLPSGASLIVLPVVGLLSLMLTCGHLRGGSLHHEAGPATDRIPGTGLLLLRRDRG
jgi:hypothetical protein